MASDTCNLSGLWGLPGSAGGYLLSRRLWSWDVDQNATLYPRLHIGKMWGVRGPGDWGLRTTGTLPNRSLDWLVLPEA